MELNWSKSHLLTLFNEVPTSSMCNPADKQINGHENNISLAEVIIKRNLLHTTVTAADIRCFLMQYEGPR